MLAPGVCYTSIEDAFKYLSTRKARMLSLADWAVGQNRGGQSGLCWAALASVGDLGPELSFLLSSLALKDTGMESQHTVTSEAPGSVWRQARCQWIGARNFCGLSDGMGSWNHQVPSQALGPPDSK